MIACDDPNDGAVLFALTLHACRHCGGRVLKAGEVYRCSCCTAAAAGAPDAFCGCGMLASWGTRPPRSDESKAPRKAQTISRWQGERPFRCARNPAVSAKSPAEVVIAFVGEERAAA